MKDFLKSGITIDHLYTLAVVARKKSFLETARELGIVQSTVSMRIAALEKAFGAKMFNRTLHGVTITEEGLVVLDAAKSALGVLEEAGMRLKSKKAAPHEKLTIATCFTGGLYMLPPILDAFEKHSGIKPALVITETTRAISKLKRGEVNLICFGRRGYANKYVRTNCEIMPIGKDELVLVVPANHELAGKNEVSLKEIAKYPFIIPMKHSEAYGEITSMSKKIEDVFRSLEVVSELESTETILTAVQRGVGISILPSLPVEEAQKSSPLKALNISGLDGVRTFYLACLKGENEKEQVKPFWEFMKMWTKQAKQ